MFGRKKRLGSEWVLVETDNREDSQPGQELVENKARDHQTEQDDLLPISEAKFEY